MLDTRHSYVPPQTVTHIKGWWKEINTHHPSFTFQPSLSIQKLHCSSSSFCGALHAGEEGKMPKKIKPKMLIVLSCILYTISVYLIM
ncbi:uncharacterized protein DS421_10g299060 [Arachis hypogaea]|nr:uncharacterized protein DS421_10g299060 [Arachis hypogaea]